ncbi:DUF5990 family protein [Gemmatimonas sp.]|uniref:DUF5990 family protein n=2 Tax=Gemmatimonas sp. TaxID=1962908 RepID=UPI00356297A8
MPSDSSRTHGLLRIESGRPPACAASAERSTRLMNGADARGVSDGNDGARFADVSGATGQLLALRLVLERPPHHVRWVVQSGKIAHLPPSAVDDESVTFDVMIRVVSTPAGTLDFRGDCVQGPRASRFVYLCAGTRAGDPSSCWDRRAKVSLMTLSTEHVKAMAAAPELRLEGRLRGTARDGGPACASVPLLRTGWTLVGRV